MSVDHDGDGCVVLAGQGYDDKYQFKETGFYDAKRFLSSNPEWKTEGRRYRAQWYTVNSDEEYFSAMLQGDPILVGRRGHSIYDGVPLYRNGRPVAGYINSWGRWGAKTNSQFDYGMGYDSTSLWGYGWVCKAVIVR